MHEIVDHIDSNYSSHDESPIEGIAAYGCESTQCKCILNSINVTSEQEVLSQTVNHITNENLKRAILKTLKDLLIESSSRIPPPKREEKSKKEIY